MFQLQAKGVTPQAREAILTAAREAGASIVSAEHPTTTLEDLFLKVVRAEGRAHGGPASAPPAPKKPDGQA